MLLLDMRLANIRNPTAIIGNMLKMTAHDIRAFWLERSTGNIIFALIVWKEISSWMQEL